MGRRRGRTMVRPGAQGLSDLCGGVPCRAHRPGRRRRAACRRRRGRQCAGRRARDCAWPNSRRAFRPPISAAARAGLADPDPMVRIGALDMLEDVPADQSLARCLAAARRSRARRAASGRRRCSRPFRPRASLRPIASASSARPAEFIAAQRANADRPEARTTLGKFSRAARTGRRGRGRVQGGAATQPAICHGGDQSRRPLPATRPGRRRRSSASRRDCSFSARGGGASRARPDA